MPRKVKVNYHKRLTIKGAEIEEEGAAPRCVFETSFERHQTWKPLPYALSIFIPDTKAGEKKDFYIEIFFFTKFYVFFEKILGFGAKIGEKKDYYI